MSEKMNTKSEHELTSAILQLGNRIRELRLLEENAFNSEAPADSLKYWPEINDLLEQQGKLLEQLNEVLGRTASQSNL